MDPISPWGVVAWSALHGGAIVTAWGTRMAIGSRVEAIMQLAFLLTLVAVGVVAAVGHHFEVMLWPQSVVTLIVMVLTAVIDLRRTHEPAHLAHQVSGR